MALESPPLILDVATLQGECIQFQTEALGQEPVESLRARIADGLGKDISHVEILHQSKQLEDGEVLSDSIVQLWRVDPQDGEPRSFKQLLQICADEYSMDELRAYWHEKMHPIPCDADVVQAPDRILLSVVITDVSRMERRALQELEDLQQDPSCIILLKESLEARLFAAAEDSFIEVLKVLVQMGGSLNAMDDMKTYPAHAAAQSGHIQVLRFLLERRADILAEGREEGSSPQRMFFVDTPAHRAAERGHAEVLRFLVDQRADPSAPGALDRRPAHYAARRGHVDVLHTLFELRADLSSVDFYGQSPLELAAKEGRCEIQKLLGKFERNVSAHGYGITIEDK